MKRFGALFFLVLILLSCDFDSRLIRKKKRAEKKIYKLTQKYPDLLKTDTIKKEVKVVVSEVKTDTTFLASKADTVYLDKERLHIKYVKMGDTIRLIGQCDADTIIKEVKVPYEKVIIQKPSFWSRIWTNLKWLLILLSIGLIARFIYKKYRMFV
jgi:hypothetical protein